MRFEYYNPSPKKRVKADGTPMKWHKGDCTTRALSKALDLSWHETFKLQCEEAAKQCENTTAKSVSKAILLANGFKKGVIDPQWVRENHCRPTVRQVVNTAYEKLGKRKVVVGCTHHLVAAEGDVLYDTWNCGEETAWSWYYKD